MACNRLSLPLSVFPSVFPLFTHTHNLLFTLLK
jgi:hypothetical protein